MPKLFIVDQAIVSLESAAREGTLSEDQLSRIADLHKLIPEVRPAFEKALSSPVVITSSEEPQNRIQGLSEVGTNPTMVQFEAGKPVKFPNEKLTKKEIAKRLAQEEIDAMREVLKAAKENPGLIVEQQARLKYMNYIELLEALSIHCKSTIDEIRPWVEKGITSNFSALRWSIQFREGALFIKPNRGAEYQLAPVSYKVKNKITGILESKAAFQLLKITIDQKGRPFGFGMNGQGPDEFDDWADRNSDNNR